MKTKLRIRKAYISDIEDIVTLWKELMDFHGKVDELFRRSDEGADNFRQFLVSQHESENSELIVAEYDGKVVGYAKLEISKYPPVFERKSYGMISDIAVSGDYRRMGIGEALVDEAAEWFAKKNIDRIEMRVVSANSVGRGFWEKMGFKPYMITKD
jgi:ribosomal protein S18 acetylase RimI-like enzyme